MQLARKSRSFLCAMLAWGIALASVGFAQSPPRDVIVYGGTPAGLCAAIAASRAGASVIVIEPTPWIGGLVTGGLSHTDKGREETIGGIAREFFTRAAAAVPGTPLWFSEPHVNMATFQQMLDEAKVTVLTGKLVKSVTSAPHNGSIRLNSITLDDGQTFSAKVFIDASYEGDLLGKAGVKSVIGRESRGEYDEPLAGYVPMPIRERSAEIMGSVCPCLGGTGPHYIHGTPCKISAYGPDGKLLSGVMPAMGEPGTADDKTQAYNYRICVTQRPDILIPFPKPANYDPARYELLLRLIQSYPKVRFGRLVHLGRIAHEKFDLNAQGLFSTDYPGGNVDYPGGDAAARERIRQDHIDYVQGFLWFLSHDERVPRELRDETNSWGLCRDEFVDNHNWPYALYVRDARRMVGEHVMTQRDIQTEIEKPDSVAMGSFVIDCHIVQRIVTADGFVTDEGSFPDAPARPYQIPYRSIIPRKNDCENLLSPVCISASHIALCSMRMEPVYMALGQASGVAAVMAIRSEKPVQEIDVPQLQATLREQKQVLQLEGAAAGPTSKQIGGLIQDDSQAEMTGTWQDSTFGNPIDGAAQHDYNAEKGTKSATFTVKVPKDGRYEVRFAYVPSPNRATNVPIEIRHAGGAAQVLVNERLPTTVDKLFVVLGEFDFKEQQPAIVIVRTTGTDGFVSVDAVQLRAKTTQVPQP
ncbi:FAD-dependent oxidoreductase [Planctomicrobium piriforme]|uniref:FAD dependent oxidoreductase n=1 Tax=Planctomicrobium piriforme TaxID=1576369 RepID=A0A1I3PBY4_9PLAN|nr:FAD-dependent oxidoreductase [Planctomicrobium piriforme]SFJ18972.1 FAD dependent oxidoreductase [Planctomicrobium piriforme]